MGPKGRAGKSQPSRTVDPGKELEFHSDAVENNREIEAGSAMHCGAKA